MVKAIAIISWFAGGMLLGVIEIIKLPTDPAYSVLLQLLPLLLLLAGISVIFHEYQVLGRQADRASIRGRQLMNAGWIAEFAVNAGVASLNNMSTEIFHRQLPYYFQGVNLAEKIIALAGIFILGSASANALRQNEKPSTAKNLQGSSAFWEKPLTNIGFIALLLGVVLGLAQYWLAIVFAGFLLLIAGAMLYPVGILTETNIDESKELDDENV